jgi:osmotically-inducible protein OsmY
MPPVSAPRIRWIAAAVLLGSALFGCAVVGKPQRGDARITADVEARLGQYPELQAPNVLDVQTVHGVVYLHGLMGTPFQIRLASSVASQVSGVRRVENLIGLDNSR